MMRQKRAACGHRCPLPLLSLRWGSAPVAAWEAWPDPQVGPAASPHLALIPGAAATSGAGLRLSCSAFRNPQGPLNQ